MKTMSILSLSQTNRSSEMTNWLSHLEFRVGQPVNSFGAHLLSGCQWNRTAGRSSCHIRCPNWVQTSQFDLSLFQSWSRVWTNLRHGFVLYISYFNIPFNSVPIVVIPGIYVFGYENIEKSLLMGFWILNHLEFPCLCWQFKIRATRKHWHSNEPLVS